MQRTNKLALAAAAALGLLASTGSHAESTYGYSSSGAAAVTATARINLSIVVPRVVVLRVGAAGATIDTLSWAFRIAIPGLPTVNVDGALPEASGASQAVTWDGTAPTMTLLGAAPTTNAYVWTNGANVTVNCSATPLLPATGPALTAITASAGAGTFTHPTGTLNACIATAALTAGTLRTATWTYTLDTTGSATWAPGAYSSVLTYTATGT